MAENPSVTHWLAGLAQGESAAVQPLWERYFQRLVQLARKKLRDVPRRLADEEDVALSAFDSFCRGAEKGQFPRLADRNDLWQVLVVLIARKACDLIQHERRQKRGGGKVRGQSVFGNADENQLGGLEEVVGEDPSPEFAALVTEQFQQMLNALNDDTLQQIALWKMENRTHQEIAEKLGVSEETIRRKLNRIKHILSHLEEENSA